MEQSLLVRTTRSIVLHHSRKLVISKMTVDKGRFCGRSVNFGGSWKCIAKTCKLAMFLVLKRQQLTEVFLATIVHLTEQLLSARPLTSMSNYPTDMEGPTPNHLLLGRPSIAMTYLPNAQKYQIHRKMLCLSQAHIDKIWSGYLKRYLPGHNFRQKWSKERPHLKENDLVWMFDDREKRVFTALEG